MSYCYEYPRPSVTVDILVYTEIESRPKEVLLIRRGQAPYAGMWALPGGFVDMDEDLPQAAERELAEETGLVGLRLRQFRTYGTPGRDPRGRTISIIYTASSEMLTVRGGDDASEAAWFDITKLPRLAFDHSLIIQDWLQSR